VLFILVHPTFFWLKTEPYFGSSTAHKKGSALGVGCALELRALFGVVGCAHQTTVIHFFFQALNLEAAKVECDLTTIA